MRRLAAALVVMGVVFWAGVAGAQEPQINITLEEQEVLVGQPVLLQVEVLVPTFMPRAPVFPTFEMPGLLVRLPERSTVPISERIGRDTWAGVRRTYRIYPMRAGVTEVPPQQIDIVYRDVDTNDDVPLSVEIPAMQITGIVPPGAGALDPLILANELAVEQVWTGTEGTLEVGDAVTRQLRITIAGASALFVPPLLETALPTAVSPTGEAPSEVAAFSPYPEDAVVTESFDRGVMSGTRSEEVNYIAQTGGTASFPDITVSWYNIDAGEIEDLVLPGQSVTVAMPPKTRDPLDRAAAARLVGLVLAVAVLIWAVQRWLWPPLKAWARSLQVRYEGTVHAAHRAAEARAGARDLTGLLDALALRTERGLPPGTPLQTSLRALTCAKYGDGTTRAEADGLWPAIERELRKERPSFLVGRGPGVTGLPALNPYSPSRR